ncbi:MAG TPA: DUF3160 domain-containing protein [Polyangiales bacterium]|nr:DUF3160 domain-containing protein [Polyangiales bacterium]
MPRPYEHLPGLCLVVGLTAACDTPSATPGTKYLDPGVPLKALALSSADRAALSELSSELAPLQALSSAQLLESQSPKYSQAALGYDPKTAANLDLIQRSSLSLDAKELDKLGTQGFVIAPRHAFPNMAYGYRTIYGLDLPVYVSLDAILTSVHLSYDAILEALEQEYLSQELAALLTEARGALKSGAISDAQAAKDVDLYLAVALSLLKGAVEPVAGARETEIDALVKAAYAANSIVRVELFGAVRDIDFSQMKPRGHYDDSEPLQRYFRASMWLGRTDFRLIETLPDGTQVFRRRQLEAVLALRSVLQGRARSAFEHVDQVVTAFVGDHDYMQLSEVDKLMNDLAASTLAGLNDQNIAQTIVDKGYGAQRIASQVIFKDPSAADQTLPLDRSFALLGQRYTADSNVFSNVVYDRVVVKDFPSRTLPNPLDAAYAALGNDAALPLLKGELERFGYAPHLARMRKLIDAHGPDYWGSNLYNLWVSSLRAAAPGAELGDPVAQGLPALVGSEAWQRRMLNTQLASWAELRHDTILYVKQSYTSGVACAFPDGYVDPYPEAFERLRLYALKGQEIAALLPPGAARSLSERIKAYFAELATVTSTLRDMAKAQRTGTPFNEAQMAFLNDAVKSSPQGCGGPSLYEGWYARLLFDKSDDEMDPTVADVHTDPGGNRPPQVLHVATGLPRLMIMTANTCEGPRAYAGVVSAYHEVVTDLNRLTDSVWATKAKDAPFVPWFTPILP